MAASSLRRSDVGNALDEGITEMVKFRCTAVLPLPADIYFVERDTDAFRRLQGRVLRLGDLEILDTWRETETKQVVRLVTRPSVRRYIPAAVKKRFNFANFAFEDCLEYHRDLLMGPRYEIPFHTLPPMFQDKIEIHGKLTIEPVDAHSCRQTLEGEAQIRIFGIRHIAEPIIVESLSKSYRQLPSVIAQWVILREEILEREGSEGLFRGRPAMDWLPSAVEREERCIGYRSPFKEALLLSSRSTVGRKNRHHRLIAAQREVTNREASLERDLDEESSHRMSDAESSTGAAAVSTPASNQTRNLSEFEAGMAFYDAVEHLSVDDTPSWQSAQSDLESTFEGGSSETLPSLTRISRRGLLHSCGFSQMDHGSCSQDEEIRRTAIREVSPGMHREPSAGEVHRGRSWMCCRARARQMREEETGCRCMCLYAFKAA